LARNVLVEPEVAETSPNKSDVEKLEQQLNISSTVGDPWEDNKWTKYKVSMIWWLLAVGHGSRVISAYHRCHSIC
jgi:hypothetical protein